MNQKTNENIFLFLPYPQKKAQKKGNIYHYIIGGFYFDSIVWFDQYFCSFLVQVKTSKFAFEIYWPLLRPVNRGPVAAWFYLRNYYNIFLTAANRCPFMGWTNGKNTIYLIMSPSLGAIQSLRGLDFILFCLPTKVLYIKYSKWLYTVAHTIDWMCRRCWIMV